MKSLEQMSNGFALFIVEKKRKENVDNGRDATIKDLYKKKGRKKTISPSVFFVCFTKI